MTQELDLERLKVRAHLAIATETDAMLVAPWDILALIDRAESAERRLSAAVERKDIYLAQLDAAELAVARARGVAEAFGLSMQERPVSQSYVADLLTRALDGDTRG